MVGAHDEKCCMNHHFKHITSHCHCTLLTVNCMYASCTSYLKMLNAHFTLHVAYYTLHYIYYTLYTTQKMVYRKHYTLHSAHYTLKVEHTLHTKHYTICYTQYKLQTA